MSATGAKPALSRVLIVDDEPANVRLLEFILEEAGYTQVCGVTDSRQVMPLVQESTPDVILLDLNMPFVTGIDLIRLLRTTDPPIPILVLTSDGDAATKYRALDEGASDFLTKPFDHREVLLRLGNLLKVRHQGLVLHEAVRDRTQLLELAKRETVERLALASEYRDDATGRHAQRVGLTSANIYRSLPQSEYDPSIVAHAAALHDVGKIGIPDSILLKPSPLTPEEFRRMQEHTKIGAKLLSGSSSLILCLAEEIALWHHEHWDGTGYWGLSGESIPLCGRIVAVADAFDAMTHDRPYRAAMSVEEALSEIESQSGRHFDPAVAEAFLGMPRELMLID